MADSPSRSALSGPALPGGRDSLHLQASALLLIGVIGGAVSTVAVVISGILASQPGGGPPGGGGPGGGNPPPPPPNTALVALIISAAFFVISWVTVAAAVARDQLAQKINANRTDTLMELQSSMEQLRADLATDRSKELKDLMTQLDAFAEQRETEGYLDAMRAAAATPATNGDVRYLRKRPPPPDS